MMSRMASRVPPVFCSCAQAAQHTLHVPSATVCAILRPSPAAQVLCCKHVHLPHQCEHAAQPLRLPLPRAAVVLSSAHLACRLLSTVGKLGCPSIWHPQAEAEEEAFASGIVREAAGHPQLLAFLTLLLVSEDVKALFLFPEDGPIAVQATRQLWAAVDCAFSTVSLQP